MNKDEICFVRQGDIIQVTDEGEKAKMWYGCTMTVDEVKPWGVQAGMKIPGQGYAFLRLKWEPIFVMYNDIGAIRARYCVCSRRDSIGGVSCPIPPMGFFELEE